MFNSNGKVSVSFISAFDVTFFKLSFHAHEDEFPRGESPFLVGRKLSTSGNSNGKQSFSILNGIPFL